jgi:hypothetical protein
MKTVTLYEITSRKVQIADTFTINHKPDSAGPRCAIGAGMSLLGMQQVPMGCVFAVGPDEYAVAQPGVRDVLEKPIIAAAEHDIALQRAELLAGMASGPWWLRVWRALRRPPSAGPHRSAGLTGLTHRPTA